MPHVTTLLLTPHRAGATYELTNKIASGWRKGEHRTVVPVLLHLRAPRELTSKAEGAKIDPACFPLIFDTVQHHATAFQILLTTRALARAPIALSSRLQLKRPRVRMLLPPHSLHRIVSARARVRPLFHTHAHMRCDTGNSSTSEHKCADPDTGLLRHTEAASAPQKLHKARPAPHGNDTPARRPTTL